MPTRIVGKARKLEVMTLTKTQARRPTKYQQILQSYGNAQVANVERPESFTVFTADK